MSYLWFGLWETNWGNYTVNCYYALWKFIMTYVCHIQLLISYKTVRFFILFSHMFSLPCFVLFCFLRNTNALLLIKLQITCLCCVHCYTNTHINYLIASARPLDWIMCVFPTIKTMNSSQREVTIITK